MARVQDDKGNWGEWKTISGRRVFIRDGEDLATAMKRSGKFGTKVSPEELTNLKNQGRKAMARAIDEENKTPYNSKAYAKELSQIYNAEEEYEDTKTPKYIQDIDAGRYGNMSDEEAIKNWIDGGADVVYTQDAEEKLKNWGIPVKNDDPYGTYKEELAKQLLPIYKEDKQKLITPNDRINSDYKTMRENFSGYFEPDKSDIPRNLRLSEGDLTDNDKAVLQETAKEFGTEKPTYGEFLNKKFGYDVDRMDLTEDDDDRLYKEYERYSSTDRYYRNMAPEDAIYEYAQDNNISEEEASKQLYGKDSIKVKKYPDDPSNKEYINVKKNLDDDISPMSEYSDTTGTGYSDRQMKAYKDYLLKTQGTTDEDIINAGREPENRVSIEKYSNDTASYEYKNAYKSYHSKLDSLRSRGSWTGKEYTNDEFMEHLTDSNWHTERKMLEDAKLTNQELSYIKDNTKLGEFTVGLDKKSTEKLIKEAKDKFRSKDVETEAKIEKYKDRKNGPQESYTKSGKLRYNAFGIERTPEDDFSDDGTRFTAYRLPNGMEMTVAKDSDDIYLSLRNPYNEKVSYEEYSNLPHYKDLDMYNGVRKDSIDLNEVVKASNEYMNEYNELLKKKGIKPETRSNKEIRLESIQKQIERNQESINYYNNKTDYSNWRYDRQQKNRLMKKNDRLRKELEKLQ